MLIIKFKIVAHLTVFWRITLTIVTQTTAFTYLYSGVTMNNKNIISDGLEILYQRYYENNIERQLELEKARLDDEIARKIINLRKSYHISTKTLAELINSDESIIESLENAEYEGDSFLMLNLIATALKMKVQIELIAV